MNINVDKTYICHYNKLTDRKINLIKDLEKNNITNYFFVELFDKDTWNKEEINKKYPLVDIYKINNNSMNDAEKSLLMKHIWIIEDMYINGYDSILVLEDDALLTDNFVEKFNVYKNELPHNWDVAWVGSCFHLHEPIEPGKLVYRTDKGSRCTHAFCLSKSFALKSIDEIKNINQPADHYYNTLLKKINANNYWFQPPLALQSTEYTSAISGNRWTKELMG